MNQQLLPSISIQNLQTIEELEKVYELEITIWSAEEATPVNHLVASVKNGGLVLGAYNQDQLIGFQYNFPGFDGRNSYLLSHSLGIHPDYRRLGIGERLKMVQKKAAIDKGYDRILWTYDPLETVNGNLNLHKLRAICTSYIENAYGDMSDEMNSGIPTDRFLVEWQVRKKTSLADMIDFQQLPLVIESSIQDGYLTAENTDLEQTGEKLLVPVPGNFQEIKKHSLSIALTWRKKTGAVFSHYLRKGWQVTDLVKDPQKENQYLYLLEKRK